MKNKMNKVFIAIFALLAACSASKFMSYEDYNKIALGQNISDVQVLLGCPYEVKEIAPHQQEYIYVERIPLGDREAFRRYIFVVDHEKIIEKKIKEEVTSNIQFTGP